MSLPDGTSLPVRVVEGGGDGSSGADKGGAGAAGGGAGGFRAEALSVGQVRSDVSLMYGSCLCFTAEV